MKSVLKKICSVMIFFVIIGTVLANTNVLNSIMPNNYSNENQIKTEENLIVSGSDELDFTSLDEISNYILNQAEYNDYKFTTVVYSSALLF